MQDALLVIARSAEPLSANVSDNLYQYRCYVKLWGGMDLICMQVIA